MSRVLVIGAHPDDAENGAGGTLLRHVAAGDIVHVLVMTGGEAGTELTEVRQMEAEAAATWAGAGVSFGMLPDTLVDEKAAIDAIEAAAAGFHPDVAYTHSCHDTHQDHRAVAVASVAALRRVPRLYAYQSPSATADFRPARFTDITDHLAGKVKLIRFHKSQDHRHYMQAGYVEASAAYWGGRGGNCPAAEPLEVIADRAWGFPS